MVHVVQSLPVKASNNVHYVSKNNSSVESSGLRVLPSAICLNLRPLSLLELVSEDVVIPNLAGVNATKYNHALVTRYSSVSVPRLRSYSPNSFDFVPVL